MSVKPVTSATITSPTPRMPERSPTAKISKFAQDDVFPDFNSPKKPTRNASVQHLSTIEEVDETELPKPIPRPSAPKNDTAPVTKSPQENLRRVALLNKAIAKDNSK